MHIYPQLSKMAVDYLAAQGSATPVERVWSAASDTDTKKRNRMSSETLAALQLLKTVYRRQRVRKMTPAERAKFAEERMRQINMEDWMDDTVPRHEVNFLDVEFDFS